MKYLLLIPLLLLSACDVSNVNKMQYTLACMESVQKMGANKETAVKDCTESAEKLNK